MVLHPGFTTDFVRKDAVELRLKGGVENGAEHRPWLEAVFHKVATEDQGPWGRVLKRELPGAIPQPLDVGEGVGRMQRRPTA